jgi:hypothetical protein
MATLRLRPMSHRWAVPTSKRTDLHNSKRTDLHKESGSCGRFQRVGQLWPLSSYTNSISPRSKSGQRVSSLTALLIGKGCLSTFS